MTLIERINSFINAVASDIKSLYADKVNKTDVIAVEQGGTGAKDAAAARNNLGLGTAAIKNVGTAEGNVMGVGAFGLGGVLSFKEPTTTPIPVGSFFLISLPSANDNTGIPGFQHALSLPWADSSCTFELLAGLGNTGDLGYRNYKWDIGWTKYKRIFNDGNSYRIDATFKSLKSGSASYKKGWRKLTATLPNQAGEATEAHGVTTVETVQAKVTNSDGIIIYNNDIDPANQFYVRVNGANLILGVTANSTKVFGKTVTIYVGEEL